jgi:hypothetical protein
MNNFSEIIMLQYPLNGDTKSGIIRLNFRLNSHGTEMDFLSIEYCDQDVLSYVENNPSVLTKIDSLRNKWKP